MNNQIDVKTNLTVITRLLTIEELKFLKKEITKELTRRHKLKKEEKRSCWLRWCPMKKNEMEETNENRTS